MAMVTASQVAAYTDISATAGTITTSGLIPIVQDRIIQYCYNQFVSEDIYVQDTMTFTATAGTIVATNDFAAAGFAAADEMSIYGSYKNDGYFTIGSVSTKTLTIASAESVVTELSGASILISLVNWPVSLAYAAAQLVKYDYDDRGKRVAGLASQSLGPRSESYTTVVGGAGYPADIVDMLDAFRIVRLM